MHNQSHKVDYSMTLAQLYYRSIYAKRYLASL